MLLFKVRESLIIKGLEKDVSNITVQSLKPGSILVDFILEYFRNSIINTNQVQEALVAGIGSTSLPIKNDSIVVVSAGKHFVYWCFFYSKY